jgi:hypothetical protein
MRIVAKAVVILFSLMVVMATTYYTLGKNLEAGVYPTDADSIGIPLMETGSSLIVILVPLTLAFLLTNIGFFRKRIVLFIGAFLYLCGALLAALLALSWFVPNHYSIAATYVLLAIVATTLAALALRMPSSNPSFKRDLLKQAP